MNPCSPRWLHIKLTLFSASLGEGLTASRLACKCGHLCVGHQLRLNRACASFYASPTHSMAYADFVPTPGNLKFP